MWRSAASRTDTLWGPVFLPMSPTVIAVRPIGVPRFRIYGKGPELMTDDKRDPVRERGEKIVHDLEEGNADAPVLAGTGTATMTEDQWHEKYGGAINESPLHLSEENLVAIREHYIWTQCESDEGRDWLINGCFSGNTGSQFPLAFNVIGHWIAAKPWSGADDAGSIHAWWGGDPDREDEPEDE